MISMSKEQMIKYLKDYASVQYLTSKYPNTPIGKLFKGYMIQQGRFNDVTREYFDIMRRVYTTYTYLKRFSFTEDFLLNRDDFLSNDDLEGIKDGCTVYTDLTNITNKKVIQLIRNAFNHNDSLDIDRFKMSLNARFCEIEFKDIRTQKEKDQNLPSKPVKIKFDSNYIIKVSNKINEESQSILCWSYDIPEDFNIFAKDLNSELDKITFIHYYFNKKMSKPIREQFNELGKSIGLTNEELLKKSKSLENLAKSIGEYKEIKLTQEQKEKIIYMINIHKEDYPDLLDEDINAIMFYFLNRVIPIPGFKIMLLDNQHILSDGYYTDFDICLNEIIKRLALVYNNQPKPKTYDYIDNEIHDGLKSKGRPFILRFYKDLLDQEFIQGCPIIMYIDAVVTQYCKDEIIKIDGIEFSKEKIRNSFAHGRWFISDKQEIIMYDADPRNINDYNLELIGKIKVASFEEWADKYMENTQKEKRSPNDYCNVLK